MASNWADDRKIAARGGVGGALAARAVGPGGLYNIGNVIALVGGIWVQMIRTDGSAGFAQVVTSYLFGNPGATCLTLAMLIFLSSGEAYHRAWRDPAAPKPRFNRLGDLLAGMGAMVLTVALVYFGDIWLALVAGFLLAGGKFGTAIIPDTDGPTPVTALFRMMVVISRFPSIASLGLALFIYLTSDGNGLDAITAGVMLVCYLIWLYADYLLLAYSRKQNAD